MDPLFATLTLTPVRLEEVQFAVISANCKLSSDAAYTPSCALPVCGTCKGNLTFLIGASAVTAIRRNAHRESYTSD
eukprot:364547-Chlamydomonas_euryale.AAC.7